MKKEFKENPENFDDGMTQVYPKEFKSLSEKEFIKFIIDNFSYSDIGKEDGCGEDKLSWMWKEDVPPKITKKLRKKFVKIIKKAGKDYYK